MASAASPVLACEPFHAICTFSIITCHRRMPSGNATCSILSGGSLSLACNSSHAICFSDVHHRIFSCLLELLESWQATRPMLSRASPIFACTSSPIYSCDNSHA
ncbi:unnamed protein product, partial [Nesidiocoris tenuis]